MAMRSYTKMIGLGPIQINEPIEPPGVASGQGQRDAGESLRSDEARLEEVQIPKLGSIPEATA